VYTGKAGGPTWTEMPIAICAEEAGASAAIGAKHNEHIRINLRNVHNRRMMMPPLELYLYNKSSAAYRKQNEKVAYPMYQTRNAAKSLGELSSKYARPETPHAFADFPSDRNERRNR
jgi:hypothetical protein